MNRITLNVNSYCIWKTKRISSFYKMRLAPIGFICWKQTIHMQWQKTYFLYEKNRMSSATDFAWRFKRCKRCWDLNADTICIRSKIDMPLYVWYTPYNLRFFRLLLIFYLLFHSLCSLLRTKYCKSVRLIKFSDIKESKSNNDPLWHLIKVYFPSDWII